ncbi:AAA family ATPase [Alcaligenes sp. 13f]|uniref:AAA family ATPase n=1 Tax=Alcaligenes sp. 13f TaxID=2841924 RepID=UPI001CF6433E|nr:AAA family ATPase [Alcaligenes sp. 13f]MCB4324350.1 AAA family ATPase [Alcaligenes sp. 13f]
MNFNISIRNIQNIKKIEFSLDLADKSLVCITGKNGSGKTMLIKAIGNLINADILSKTSAPRIVSDNSEINYEIGGKSVIFKYNKKLKMLDSRDTLSKTLKDKLSVELPIPYGERFNFFKKIGGIDNDIRRQVVLQRYSRPTELIDFLKAIYATNKFDNLVEIQVKNVPYYVIPYEDNYYLREDYFSSGEYFLISLYRRIRSNYLAVFIDEIDISLDAAAQVCLVEWLNKFKEIYKTKFIFTTHSLAMMQTLSDNLFCMEEQADGSITIEKRSYGFIKSTLFGFNGWEKYILTEDEALKDFLIYLIDRYCAKPFYQFKIIYIGGGTNTTDLMQRNKIEKFFSEEYKNVMAILDGDQKGKAHAKKENVHCIPMESIEKELLSRCLLGEFWDTVKFRALIKDHERLTDFMHKKNNGTKKMFKVWFYKFLLLFSKNTESRRKLSAARGEPIKERDFSNAGKRLFKHLIQHEYTKQQIFEFLIEKNPKEITALRRTVEEFLSVRTNTKEEAQTIESVVTSQ